MSDSKNGTPMERLMVATENLRLARELLNTATAARKPAEVQAEKCRSTEEHCDKAVVAAEKAVRKAAADLAGV